VDETRSFLPEDRPGWWTSLAAQDLDGDGDEDLLAGNYGLNTQFHVSDSLPLTLLYKNFDGNGKTDAVTSYYIDGRSWPSPSLDDLVEKMPFLRKRFNTYAAYANATSAELFTQEERSGAVELKAMEMRTVLFENKEGKKFVLRALPIQAQFAPVFASAVFDFDRDGRKDLLLCGNQSGTRIKFGKYDANTGFLFRNEGNMRFSFVQPQQTGLYLRGDVRSVAVAREGRQIYFGIHGGAVQAVRRK
jgi:hypothetical protein